MPKENPFLKPVAEQAGKKLASATRFIAKAIGKSGKAEAKAAEELAASKAAKLQAEMKPVSKITSTATATRPVTQVPTFTPSMVTPSITPLPKVNMPTFSQNLSKVSVNPAEVPNLIKAQESGVIKEMPSKSVTAWLTGSKEGADLVDTYGASAIDPFAKQIVENTALRSATQKATADAARLAAKNASSPEAMAANELAAITKAQEEQFAKQVLPEVLPTEVMPMAQPLVAPKTPIKYKGNLLAGAGIGTQAAVNAYNAQEGADAPSWVTAIANLAGLAGASKLALGSGKKLISKTEGASFKQAPALINKEAEGLRKLLNTKTSKTVGLLTGVTGVIASGASTISTLGSDGTPVPPTINPASAFTTPDGSSDLVVDTNTPKTTEALTVVDYVNKERAKAEAELAASGGTSSLQAQQLAAIDAIYNTSIENIKSAYQPVIDQEQILAKQATSQQDIAAQALQAGIDRASLGLENANPLPAGLSPEQASAAGLSTTALGGAGTTYGSLLQGLGGAMQAQSAADQLQLGTNMSDLTRQAMLAQAGDIAGLEQSRAGDKTSTILANAKDAIDMARTQYQNKINYLNSINAADLQPVSGAGTGVNLPFNTVSTDILNNPSITSLATVAPGFIGSPQLADNILSTLKGAAASGGDYTNRTTALAAWSDLYSKLYNTYSDNQIQNLFTAAGWPSTAQGMVNSIFAAGK
jgi:hypothetical protein